MGSRVHRSAVGGIAELHRGQEQSLLAFPDANYVGIALSGKLGAAPRDAKRLDQDEGRPLVSRRSRAAGAEPSRRTTISQREFFVLSPRYNAFLHEFGAAITQLNQAEANLSDSVQRGGERDAFTAPVTPDLHRPTSGAVTISPRRKTGKTAGAVVGGPAASRAQRRSGPADGPTLVTKSAKQPTTKAARVPRPGRANIQGISTL